GLGYAVQNAFAPSYASSNSQRPTALSAAVSRSRPTGSADTQIVMEPDDTTSNNSLSSPEPEAGGFESLFMPSDERDVRLNPVLEGQGNAGGLPSSIRRQAIGD